MSEFGWAKGKVVQTSGGVYLQTSQGEQIHYSDSDDFNNPREDAVLSVLSGELRSFGLQRL